MTIAQYNESAEASVRLREGRKDMADQFELNGPVTTRVANLCRFRCPVCRAEFETAPALKLHQWRKCRGSHAFRESTNCCSKVVLHRCFICHKTVLCERTYLRNHLKYSHKLKIAAYVSCTQRQTSVRLKRIPLLDKLCAERNTAGEMVGK